MTLIGNGHYSTGRYYHRAVPINPESSVGYRAKCRRYNNLRYVYDDAQLVHQHRLHPCPRCFPGSQAKEQPRD